VKIYFKSKKIPLIATTLLAAVAITSHSLPMNVFKDEVVAANEVEKKVIPNDRSWIAGDHHVHSEWSVGWDNSTNPPTPIRGGDAIYPIVKNAQMADKFGLDWMVSTDHGGPNHSKVNLEQAYPEVLKAREEVPGINLFYGMEFDTPAADHSSLIIPKTEDESQNLYNIESQFNKRETSGRDNEETMIEALKYMRSLTVPPVLFANHPSRSASGESVWGQDTPEEFRNWNDTAPTVSVGMEGSPGHQAGTLNSDGTLDPNGDRGGYGNYPTMGGYDQMTAEVGGLWDSMLGEGRHWWVTSSSDSHIHYTEGGSDFWPGEYSKTYVHAANEHGDILDGLRNGRIFVTTGDLINQLDVTAQAVGKSPQHAQSNGNRATIGETLEVPGNKTRDVNVTVRFKDPNTDNNNGDNPKVNRVDFIMGEVNGQVEDRSTDTNSTTKVIARFDEKSWKKDGEFITITYTVKNVEKDSYIRVRGTNTDELEPKKDSKGEDPWADLWFYSNPIFINVK
jgi:hypothetical protein